MVQSQISCTMERVMVGDEPGGQLSSAGRAHPDLGHKDRQTARLDSVSFDRAGLHNKSMISVIRILTRAGGMDLLSRPR